MSYDIHLKSSDGQSQSVVQNQGSFSDFEWLDLRRGLGISLGAGVVAMVLEYVIWNHFKFQVGFGLAAFFALLVGVNLRIVYSSVDDRYIDPEDLDVNWKLDVTVENLMTAPRDFDRVRHILATAEGPEGLVHEDSVKRFTHEHRFFLWSSVAPFLALALISFVSALVLVAWRPIQFSAWWLLLSTVVFLIAAWVASFSWKYKSLMVTHWSTYLITMPPVWLPLWQPNIQRVSYDEMDTATVRNSRIGNLVGKLLGKGRSWGAVELDTPSPNDVAFNYIPRLPDHRAVQLDVESARMSYKLLISGASRSDSDPELLEAVKENTRVMRQYLAARSTNEGGETQAEGSKAE